MPDSYPESALSSLTRQAKELLSGIPGIRGVGVGWDGAGNRILQIDLTPDTDRAAVERRLDVLEAPVRFRNVSGTITQD
jgi:hypothetical protein